MRPYRSACETVHRRLAPAGTGSKNEPAPIVEPRDWTPARQNGWWNRMEGGAEDRPTIATCAVDRLKPERRRRATGPYRVVDIKTDGRTMCRNRAQPTIGSPSGSAVKPSAAPTLSPPHTSRMRDRQTGPHENLREEIFGFGKK